MSANRSTHSVSTRQQRCLERCTRVCGQEAAEPWSCPAESLLASPMHLKPWCKLFVVSASNDRGWRRTSKRGIKAFRSLKPQIAFVVPVGSVTLHLHPRLHP